MLVESSCSTGAENIGDCCEDSREDMSLLMNIKNGREGEKSSVFEKARKRCSERAERNWF